MAECSYANCTVQVRALGLCQGHWSQQHKGKELTELRPRAVEPEWKVRKDGYVQRSIPGKRQEFQHRWVMEQSIGRPLRSEENVHHRNGLRDDNRPDNLELWVKKQPPGARVADRLAWAVSLLSEYGEVEFTLDPRYERALGSSR